ncbi:hypothetical protein [Roseivivax sp. CAU 1761]
MEARPTTLDDIKAVSENPVFLANADWITGLFAPPVAEELYFGSEF